jgi:hypothetical protein
MGHKKNRSGPAPVPPANRPKAGPEGPVANPEQQGTEDAAGAPFEDQDARRRLGRYETAGEHSIVQPDQGRGNKE